MILQNEILVTAAFLRCYLHSLPTGLFIQQVHNAHRDSHNADYQQRNGRDPAQGCILFGKLYSVNGFGFSHTITLKMFSGRSTTGEQKIT